MSDPETPPPAVGPVEAGPGGGGGDPLAGSVVGERYRLIERIGEGGMGAVYRGEHTLMKKVVAVKLLHPELGRLDEVAKRFEREAQSASRLSHENIIQVTDFGRTPSGQLFLVMELLRGESLAELLARERALPPARAVAIARQILLALDHAHAQGVVHRDLKPANIMLVSRTSMMPVAGTNPLSPNDRVKILDFGIAKMSDPASDADAATGATRATPLTEAGVVFGTPEYMSPEQATGESADGRADLYACGVILFEMLAGRRPFESESRVGLLAMHLTAAPPPLRRFAPEAPAALEAVVLRALEKRREQRFATAAELLAALDAAAGSTGSDPQWITGARRRLAPIALRIEPIRRRIETALAPVGTRLAPAWRRVPGGRFRSPALAALGLAALVALGLGARARHHGPASAPPARRAVPPEIVKSTSLAEAALATGEVAKARAILTEELSAHPDVAVVHYLLANVDFAERQPEVGLSSYREAIRLDPGYRADPALLHNARALVDDRKLGADALDLLMYDVGKPACPALAEIASSERRAEMRHAALRAVDDLACAERVDLVASYALDLQQGRSCEERRETVRRLRQLGDKRALEPLRRAQHRRAGGFLGLFGGSPNDCIKKDLEETIKALESG